MRADTGSAKNIQTWPPLPDLDRSSAAGTPFARQVSSSALASCPAGFVKIDCQKPDCMISQHQIDTRHETAASSITAAQMPDNDIIVNRNEFLMGAVAAFDLGFATNSPDPFIGAGGRIPGPPGFCTFPPHWKDIRATREQLPEQLKFFVWRRMVCHRGSTGNSWVNRIAILRRDQRFQLVQLLQELQSLCIERADTSTNAGHFGTDSGHIRQSPVATITLAGTLRPAE